MKNRRMVVAVVVVAHAFALASCVTTFFFPARLAEKAADKVIDEIWSDLSKTGVAKMDGKKS